MQVSVWQKKEYREAAKWIRYHGILWRKRNRWCGYKKRTQRLQFAWEKVCYHNEILDAEGKKAVRDYLEKIWDHRNFEVNND